MMLDQIIEDKRVKNCISIRMLMTVAHDIAIEKGWWEKERGIPECLCLIHSEVSEALDEFRQNRGPHYLGEGGKPEGIAVELADVVIRIADLCGQYGWDLEEAIVEKLAYNSTRPYRHGGKSA